MTLPRINGVRGWGLLALGVSSIVRGYSYLPVAVPGRIPGALDRLSEYISLTAYATLWILAGALAVVQAFRAPNPITGKERDFASVAANAGMWSVWGYSYLLDWVASAVHGNPAERSYLNAATYLGAAFLIYCWGLQGRPRKG